MKELYPAMHWCLYYWMEVWSKIGASGHSTTLPLDFVISVSSFQFEIFSVLPFLCFVSFDNLCALHQCGFKHGSKWGSLTVRYLGYYMSVKM